MALYQVLKIYTEETSPFIEIETLCELNEVSASIWQTITPFRLLQNFDIGIRLTDFLFGLHQKAILSADDPLQGRSYYSTSRNPGCRFQMSLQGWPKYAIGWDLMLLRNEFFLIFVLFEIIALLWNMTIYAKTWIEFTDIDLYVCTCCTSWNKINLIKSGMYSKTSSVVAIFEGLKSLNAILE